MTNPKLAILLLTLLFCLHSLAQTTPKSYQQKNTSNWIENFKEFRDALYQNDKSKAKAFFNFPFINKGNEIWYLVYADDQKAMESVGKKVKPFTEKDFDKHFTKVFTKQFIQCLQKIKTNDLIKIGETESPEIKDSSTIYKLYVKYNKTKKTVELNLETRVDYDIADDEMDEGQFNYIYLFSILKNGHLKLKQILMAG